MKGFFHNTVFEYHRKSLIQDCERSELRLHFEWLKALQVNFDRKKIRGKCHYAKI